MQAWRSVQPPPPPPGSNGSIIMSMSLVDSAPMPVSANGGLPLPTVAPRHFGVGSGAPSSSAASQTQRAQMAAASAAAEAAMRGTVTLSNPSSQRSSPLTLPPSNSHEEGQAQAAPLYHPPPSFNSTPPQPQPQPSEGMAAFPGPPWQHPQYGVGPTRFLPPSYPHPPPPPGASFMPPHPSYPAPVLPMSMSMPLNHPTSNRSNSHRPPTFPPPNHGIGLMSPAAALYQQHQYLMQQHVYAMQMFRPQSPNMRLVPPSPPFFGAPPTLPYAYGLGGGGPSFLLPKPHPSSASARVRTSKRSPTPNKNSHSPGSTQKPTGPSKHVASASSNADTDSASTKKSISYAAIAASSPSPNNNNSSSIKSANSSSTAKLPSKASAFVPPPSASIKAATSDTPATTAEVHAQKKHSASASATRTSEPEHEHEPVPEPTNATPVPAPATAAPPLSLSTAPLLALQQPAHSDFSLSPPPSLLFSPDSSEEGRRTWDELLAQELESNLGYLCKKDREGFQVECRDPNRPDAAPTLDADFAYVHIRSSRKPVRRSQKSNVQTRSPPEGSKPTMDGLLQQRPAPTTSSQHNGVALREKEAKDEYADAHEEKSEEKQEDEDETEDEAEEIRAAARYHNPLVDLSFTSSQDTTTSSANGDNGSMLSPTSSLSPRSPSSSHASTPYTAMHPDARSESQLLSHAHRRVFSIQNTHPFPVILSVRFLHASPMPPSLAASSSYSSPTGSQQLQYRSNPNQFKLYLPEGGAPLDEHARIRIDGAATVRIVAVADPADDVGLVTHHVLYQLDLPALWTRATRVQDGAGPEVDGDVATTPHVSLASTLLSYQVKRIIIVRALKVLNTDPLSARLLDRESKSWYPLSLRRVFDHPAALEIHARAPPLPKSFTMLLEHIEEDCERWRVPQYLSEAFMEVQRAQQYGTPSTSISASTSSSNTEHATQHFQSLWRMHVESLRTLWTSTPDWWDKQSEAESHGLWTESNASVKQPSIELRAKIRSHCFNMHLALHVEELQLGVDVRSYDLFDVRLHPPPSRIHIKQPASSNQDEDSEGSDTTPLQFVQLSVPGVAERRPAVALGERIELRVAEPEHVSIAAFAVVAGVREDMVLLSFPLKEVAEKIGVGEEDVFKRMRFHVRFSYDRIPFAYMYRALFMLHGSQHAQRFLFPTDAAQESGEAGREEGQEDCRDQHGHVSSNGSSFGYTIEATDRHHPFDSTTLSSKWHGRSRAQLPDLTPFDPQLNFEQLTAVQHVVARSMRCAAAAASDPDSGVGVFGAGAESDGTQPLPIHVQAPFILFGPPGTGKSKTLVEAALQLLDVHSNSLLPSRLLIVAPSNYACDVVTERLAAHLDESAMIRLNSFQRHTSVKPALHKYCHHDTEVPSHYGMPSAQELAGYRVVVMTCALAGCLLDLGIASGFFTSILFDESCQALEPESLIPLCLAGKWTNVFMAGDPQQLPPEVHAHAARELGLKISLQERLLKQKLYRRCLRDHVMGEKDAGEESAIPPHQLSTCCAIQLVKNYRSHQRLLAISSALFYDGRLEAYARPEVVNSLVEWETLPNRHNFPLLFYGIVAPDIFEREYSSFYNPVEAAKVVQLIEQLLRSKSIQGISSNDIGVIAPYRKQVLIIRSLLRARRLGSIRVGSVDDYQGNEEKVIFVSTVVSRSRDRLTRATSSSSSGTNSASSSSSSSSASSVPLGILRSPQRFNVALSRAKALTVCVGNPFLLACEENWRDLLVYALENGCYAGVACPLQKEVEAKKVLGGGTMHMHMRMGGRRSRAEEMIHTAAAAAATSSNIDSSSRQDMYHGLDIRHHPLFAGRGEDDDDSEDLVGDDEDFGVDPNDVTWSEEASDQFWDGAWRIML